MGFNKKRLKNSTKPLPSTPIYVENRVETKEQEGNFVLTRTSVEKVDVNEVASRVGLIHKADYTLDKLIKAGVPLDRVNVSNLIGTNDLGEIDEKLGEIVADKYEDLLDEDARIERAKRAEKVNNEEIKTE